MTLFSEVFARRMHLIAPQTTDVRHERDLAVAMDDGVTLLADRWVAADTDGLAQPTVLVRSPYGRSLAPGLLFGRLFAERGFQVVIQSVRGTFGSGGDFAPFDERADGAATLRWLDAQPWHDGRVATMGPSYLGLTQWALAADAGPRLAAMAIQVSASEFHDQTYAGGSVSLETIASWMVILAVQERRLAPLAINRALRSLTGQLGEHPLIGVDEVATGAPVAWLRESFEQPGRDGDFWARRDFSATVGQVSAPASFVGGWQDILTPWMLDDFVALQNSSPPTRGPRLLIGPWTHTAPQLMAAGHRDSIAFLRAHLLGDDRLLTAEARALPVRLKVTGQGGGWRDFAVWPPPAEPQPLYLADGDRLAAAAPGPQDDGAAQGYRYDPADPTPAFGGPVLMSRAAIVDNAELEARADVLTFTGEPLAAALEVIGRPVVRIWARGSVPYFDLFARICEVDADGVSRNVCDALCSVNGDRDRAEADGSFAVEFELWPCGHRFAAGHRIRLLISSGAHPRYARNPGTGADPAGAEPATMRAVEIEVLRDATHPSGVTLPVVAPADGRSAAGAGGSAAGEPAPLSRP